LLTGHLASGHGLIQARLELILQMRLQISGGFPVGLGDLSRGLASLQRRSVVGFADPEELRDVRAEEAATGTTHPPPCRQRGVRELIIDQLIDPGAFLMSRKVFRSAAVFPWPEQFAPAFGRSSAPSGDPCC